MFVVDQVAVFAAARQVDGLEVEGEAVVEDGFGEGGV